MHRDLVKNEWSAGYQVLMERIGPDDWRVEAWPQATSGWATYVNISSPHSEQDCPFKDVDRVQMQSVSR